VSWRLLLLSAAVSLSLFGLAVWPFGLSVERAALLTPVFVITAGAAVGLILLWSKALLESARRR
jgi:hypothetical protein